MDERLAKQYWWEAYRASLSGLRAEGSFGVGLDVPTLAGCAGKDADAALAAFEKRWPEKEAGDA